MKLIHVRSKETKDKDRVIFDQHDAGIKLGKAVRVVIRANGSVHAVDGSLKVVRDAINRGELVVVGEDVEAAPEPTAKAEK